VIDESTIAFADFRGNKQYISTGNLLTDNRVALILVDYPRQLSLKILGRVRFSKESRRESGPRKFATRSTRHLPKGYT